MGLADLCKYPTLTELEGNLQLLNHRPGQKVAYSTHEVGPFPGPAQQLDTPIGRSTSLPMSAALHHRPSRPVLVKVLAINLLGDFKLLTNFAQRRLTTNSHEASRACDRFVSACHVSTSVRPLRTCGQLRTQDSKITKPDRSCSVSNNTQQSH